MGAKCSRQSAKKQLEQDEAERLKKLEERAMAELEERKLKREREEAERLLKEMEEEEKRKELEAQLAQEREKEREEEQQNEDEELLAPVVVPLKTKSLSVKSDDHVSHSSSISQETVPSKGSLGSRKTSLASNGPERQDGAVSRPIFTPFSMRRTDEIAKYLITKCGCALSDSHNNTNCVICQSVDLSDAPLIA